MQNSNPSGAFVHAIWWRPAHGVHPRHPPRTFPLGLLGPRCLGSVLFLASAACGRLARARNCLGGGRNPPPSSSSPRASASRRARQSRAGLGQPSSPTPILVFKSVFVARFLSPFCKLTAALIQGRGRPSGNVRGAKPMRLPHTTHARANPPSPACFAPETAGLPVVST